MKKRLKLTPEMLAQLSPEDKRVAKLILETLERPKLARVSGTWPPSEADPVGLREAIEAGNRRALSITPEQREQDARDEAELLAWWDREGNKQKLHPLVEGNVRIALLNRGDLNRPTREAMQIGESLGSWRR